jgi:hypothetical protein
MVRCVGRALSTWRTVFVCAVMLALAGCGSGAAKGDSDARADAVGRTASAPTTSSVAVAQATSSPCAQTVLSVLGDVALRVYREGVSSERTATALHLVTASRPLREAVEQDDPRGVRAAAQALLATGHLTNLKVVRRGRTLAEVGAPGALAPLSGTIVGAGGATVGSFVASVWARDGLISEIDGIDSSRTVLRANGHDIGGAFALPAGTLPAQGTLAADGVSYRYTSFPATAYPTGSPLRVYVLRPIASTAPLCAQTSQDTTVNTLVTIAKLIYAGEIGQRARVQVRRVQHDRALLSAVARRDPAAARTAIEALLNQHIVRLRVNGGGRLLSDVGGPFVLAPLEAPLRLGGRTIGSFVLSIQDDEGYLRLAHRLAGLDVLMYMGPRLVKNSLGPAPGTPPADGSYRYRGHVFRVFTLHVRAFPSGPLRIQVLVPIPYA